MPVTYATLLIVFGAFFAVLAFMWKIGVMPTRGFRLVWRRDDPDRFDAGMTILSVVFVGVLVIGLFSVWADRNSARLSAESAAIAERAR